ncbi:MAG TPA: recombinase family protein [Pyrinomonadaceae bacterium]|nr:recombinase family protein [Pyrinomonadaceae bacterium]
MKKLDASYLRVSTAMQREIGTIESQRLALARYFEQQGIRPDLQFEDDGISGSIEIHKRPQGSELYRIVSEGRVARLFCFGLDRIGRDTIDALLFLRLAESHGTQIIGISDGTDTAREGSALESEIKTVLNAQFRRDCTRRTRAGLRRRATEGKVSTRPPFGFKSIEGRLVIDDRKASVMRSIFRDVANGLRTRDIVARLNEDNEPSPTGRGWRHDTLIYLLKHRAYVGEYFAFTTPKKRRGGGRRIPRDPQDAVVIPCPAIVTTELFNAVQDRLAFNRRWCANGGKRFYLLRSLIRCGKCGLSYVGHAIVGRKYRDRVYPEVRYYECGSVSNRDYQFCRNARLNADRIEKAIWSEIEGFLETPSRVLEQLAGRLNKDMAVEQKNFGRDRKKLETLRRKNLEARERLALAVARGVVSDTDAQLAFAELTREAEGLDNRQSIMERTQAHEFAQQRQIVNAEALLRTLRERLERGFTPAKRSELARQLVKKVVVDQNPEGRAIVEVEYVFPAPVCFGSGVLALSASSLKK